MRRKNGKESKVDPGGVFVGVIVGQTDDSQTTYDGSKSTGNAHCIGIHVS